MTDTKILTIPAPPSAPSVQYAGLPDEAATNLVAELLQRARKCSQPFFLERFDRLRHLRGLCIGVTSSAEPIAVFYISEAGNYAWAPAKNLHVTTQIYAQQWLPRCLQVGMLYWFRSSDSGNDHAKAEQVGTVGPLKTHYLATHTPPQKTTTKKTKDGNEDAGDSPALRPSCDGFDFEPLKSLDELGL